MPPGGGYDRIDIERPANKSQVEISAFGSSKKATQKQAAEHLKIETAANQMV